MSRFHTHITLSNVTAEQLKQAAQLVRGKPTTIDLSRDTRTQIDRMITKYYKGTEEALDDIVNCRHILKNITRAKVERVVKDFNSVNLDSCLYLEAHIKVKDSTNTYEGFQRSNNPNEAGTRFFNARIRNYDELERFNLTLEIIRSTEVVLREQLEVVIYDDNEDSWWA